MKKEVRGERGVGRGIKEKGDARDEENFQGKVEVPAKRK